MGQPPHILVVDDHAQIRESVTRYLAKNGMRATAAKDAADMDAKLAAGHFDLVVLDVMMPGEDGLSACRRLAAEGAVPVIMLTALGEEPDRIAGLEIGADDYLAKPFNPRELLARIRSVLRRSSRGEPLAGKLAGRKVRFEHLVLDTDRQILIDDDQGEIPLTDSEFRLLVVMLERARMVLSRDQLLDLTIDNQISRLRRKIEPDVLRPRIIRTVRNGGYCLATDVEEQA